MGFTPLEGLVMGTRSGDLDPALVSYLARKENVDAEEVERWLNQRSGLLGLSGLSSDMRDLIAAMRTIRERVWPSRFFVTGRANILGAYLAALGGANAMCSAAASARTRRAVREKICDGWNGAV